MTAAKKIYTQIPKVMADVEAIGKGRKNSAQGYQFRGIDDVFNALHPLLAKHGVFVVPQVVEEKSEERQSKSGNANIYRILKIRFLFCADDGSSVEAVMVGEGMDSGDKAANKAMSAALKYALLQVFSIPTEDISDGDYDSHEVLPKTAPGVDHDRIAKMLAAYNALGVTQKMIETTLGHQIKHVNPQQLDTLAAVYQTIKAGTTKVADHFLVTPAAELNQKFKETK